MWGWFPLAAFLFFIENLKLLEIENLKPMEKKQLHVFFLSTAGAKKKGAIFGERKCIKSSGFFPPFSHEPKHQHHARRPCPLRQEARLLPWRLQEKESAPRDLVRPHAAA
jgi:hypothetical protein